MPDALRLKASVQPCAGRRGMGPRRGVGQGAARREERSRHRHAPEAPTGLSKTTAANASAETARARRIETPPGAHPDPSASNEPGTGAESAHRKRGPNNGRRPRKTEPSSNGVEPSLALAASQSNPKRAPRANRTTWSQADNRITWRQARKSRFAQVSHGRGRFASAGPCRLRATSTRAAKAHAPEITRQSAGPASGTLTGR